MNKNLVITLIVIAIVGVIFALSGQEGPKKLGGGSVFGGAYTATTSQQNWVDATQFHLLKSGPGVLGSVVITLSSATTFNLYDATTTVNGGIYGTTTLAKFGASVGAGTYVFDAAFARGLIIEYPAGQVTPASTTITIQ